MLRQMKTYCCSCFGNTQQLTTGVRKALTQTQCIVWFNLRNTIKQQPNFATALFQTDKSQHSLKDTILILMVLTSEKAANMAVLLALTRKRLVIKLHTQSYKLISVFQLHYAGLCRCFVRILDNLITETITSSEKALTSFLPFVGM